MLQWVLILSFNSVSLSAVRGSSAAWTEIDEKVFTRQHLEQSCGKSGDMSSRRPVSITAEADEYRWPLLSHLTPVPIAQFPTSDRSQNLVGVKWVYCERGFHVTVSKITKSKEWKTSFLCARQTLSIAQSLQSPPQLCLREWRNLGYAAQSVRLNAWIFILFALRTRCISSIDACIS